MRCSHCHSGRMKRAENFGAERMQCGSCGILTKRAETRLTEKQQEFINYVSMWPTERIENAWEVTQDLDQNGISMAIGISRSNVPRLVEPLIRAGLVRKKKAHILDENNRVKSVKKWVYYLTPEGRKHVTESRRAETFDAEEPFICPECRRASTKSKTSQVCVRCESEYQSGLNPPMRVPWPGDDGYYAETFEANWFSNLFSRSSGEDLYLMQMEMLDEDEIEPYRNPVVMKSAGYRLWQACFLACLDEGLSPIKAEELCNSKFIRKFDPAMMIPSLKEAMRPLIKQYLSYTDRDGKSYREVYFEAHEGGHIDDIGYVETFEAETSHCTHCGWNLVQVPIGTETKWGVAIEGNQYYYNHNACRGIGKLPIKAETFEAPKRNPIRPTRPSEDWPTPDGRPRRPRRRKVPAPGPERRPF